MKYAVVNTDNFNGDYPEEYFVTPYISEDAAEKIAEILNTECGGGNAPRYWKVVACPYTLAPGFEP